MAFLAEMSRCDGVMGPIRFAFPLQLLVELLMV
jgi:hypothetical protein